MLPRPGAPARGDCRPKEPRRAKGSCSQKGTLQTQMSNEATNGLAPSVFDHFSGAVRACSCVFPPTSEEDPKQETTGSDSRHLPEVWCSRERTTRAQSAEAWCSRTETLHAKNFNTACNPSLEYSTDKVALFWQPPHPIFHSGPLRRLTWTTCYILARSSIRWPKRPGF